MAQHPDIDQEHLGELQKVVELGTQACSGAQTLAT